MFRHIELDGKNKDTACFGAISLRASAVRSQCVFLIWLRPNGLGTGMQDRIYEYVSVYTFIVCLRTVSVRCVHLHLSFFFALSFLSVLVVGSVFVHLLTCLFS